MVVQGGVLRRKLSTARTAVAEGDTGARAWRVAFARAAREVIGLDMAVAALRDDRQSLGELLDQIPDHALLALLEGPQQSLGLLVLSPAALAAVIEMQTIGRLAAQPGASRRPTRTDAAMSARLVDHALALLDTALASSADLVWAGGFRYASFLDEARALGLLLEDVPWRVLDCTLELAGGSRQGQVLLALPAEGRGPAPVHTPTMSDSGPGSWQSQLQIAIMGSEVTLDAVIGRLKLPLGQAMALEPGMLLPLADGGGLDRVAIMGAGGAVLAGHGRLGQHRGMRALKLHPRSGAGPATPTLTEPQLVAQSTPTQARPDPAATAPQPPIARSA